MIDDSTLASVSECAVSFAAANGLQVETKSDSSDKSAGSSYVCAPISLLPNAYPKVMFDRAQRLAPPLNELVDRISRDGDFLKDTLKDVRDVDVYTGKLLTMYEDLYGDAEKGKFARSADRLGILRSDYMLHRKDAGAAGEYELKQVELNTIASSFAGLAATVARLHSFLTERFDDGGVTSFLEANERAVLGEDKGAGDMEGKGVPESPALARISKAMALTHERYETRFLSDNKAGKVRPVVLFVVQPGETNTVDQRMLEFALWEHHKVPVVRMSLADIDAKMKFDDASGALQITDDNEVTREVSLVYFRAGYAPTDYPGGDDGPEWSARETLERGRAAKCPCLGYHLAGTKKVQQELARAGTVERFFPGNDEASFVRTAFAGLYSLGADANDDDLAAVMDVLRGEGGEGQYVLKPQREGGGYNYYGQDLAEKLRSEVTLDDEGKPKLSKDLSEFILMERLFPPQQRAILLRKGAVEGSGMSISEFGCFGTVLVAGDDDDDASKVVHNEYAGFLLRTKFSGVDEGGVASGFATLSSPYLC